MSFGDGVEAVVGAFLLLLAAPAILAFGFSTLGSLLDPSDPGNAQRVADTGSNVIAEFAVPDWVTITVFLSAVPILAAGFLIWKGLSGRFE